MTHNAEIDAPMIQTVAWSRYLPVAYRKALEFGAGLPSDALRRKIRWRGGTFCVDIVRFDIAADGTTRVTPPEVIQ